MKLLKQTTYIRYVLAKQNYQNLSKSAHRFYFTEDSLKIKKGLELVSRPYFSYNFFKKISFVILNKLAKFHYQTVFTSQVIQ